jgi:hypothetical protein
VYGATITPFGGNTYDDPEVSRQAVNKWIRTSGVFDAVVDFDAAVRDAKNASRLDAAYDSGEGLHLNPARVDSPCLATREVSKVVYSHNVLTVRGRRQA